MSKPVLPDPAVSAQLLSYFQAEAGDHCEALIVQLSAEPSPGSAQTARAISHARVIRGGAAVADLATLSEVAGHVERVLKAVYGRRLAWTETLSSQLRGAASQLLDLVRAAAKWSGEHEQAARDAAALLARYDVPRHRAEQNLIVPIGKLFHADSGPHIVFMPATPQTQFEQQLRALAHRGASGGAVATPATQRPEERRTPTAPRGHELRALLGASVSRMNASFAGAEIDPIPIESLLYSGAAALDRAREVARVIRARGPENSRELLPELIDLLDLASSR